MLGFYQEQSPLEELLFKTEVNIGLFHLFEVITQLTALGLVKAGSLQKLPLGNFIYISLAASQPLCCDYWKDINVNILQH